jgi:hypothetical protein
MLTLVEFRSRLLSGHKPIVDWPPSLYPGVHHGSRKSRMFDSLRQSNSPPLRIYQGVRSAISGLFFPGRPATIPRFVIAIGVDSLQRCPRRTFSHIFKESLKTVLPLLAHCNAPPAIISIGMPGWLIASFFGVKPGAISRSISLSMRGRTLYGLLARQASAALDAAAQIIRTYRFDVSAIASTNPGGKTLLTPDFVRSSLNNYKSSESISNFIF